MTRHEYEAKLAEMDRLLNDCDIPLMPERIWSLLAELTRVADDRDTGASIALPSPAAIVAQPGPG